MHQRTYSERASAHYLNMGNVVIKDRRAPLKAGALFMEALADALEFAARERAEENDRAFTSSHSH